MPLVPLINVGPTLGAKDRRTIRRRLRALHVPMIDVGGRVMVDPDDVAAAIGRAKMDTGAARPTARDNLPPVTGKLF